MLLRRVMDHVKTQNWTAVALDFVIVVVGVFIGIQVANWNEARAERAQEAAILAQLNAEFLEIENALQKQVTIRERYVADIGRLIAGLERAGPMPEDSVIKRALIALRSTGRRPAQSAAYLQLTANGELARLSNEDLKQALIQYHTRLERDAFIFPEMMRFVIEEMSINKFVDIDANAPAPAGAAIDVEGDYDEIRSKGIRSYDLEGLREHEGRYEAMHEMQETLVATDKIQLDLVKDILNEISEGRD